MPPCHQVPPLQGLVAQGSWLAQLGQGSQSPMSAKTTAWPPMVPWPLEQDPVIKQGFSTALSLPWVPNPPAQAGDEVWSPSALCSGALGPAVSVGETIPSNSIQFHPNDAFSQWDIAELFQKSSSNTSKTICAKPTSH